MIYWERHNPAFTISLANPLDVGYDIFRWWGLEGWIDYLDVDLIELEFSPPIPVARVCQELRKRVCIGTPVRNPHHLIVYYYEQSEVCLSLIGSPDERLFQGLNTVSPEWWSLEEDLTPMQRLLERITVLTEVVKHQKDSDPRYRYPSHLETAVEGFCRRCGLPMDRHVSHDVPGFDGRIIFGFDGRIIFATAEEARPYATAFKQHYGGALKSMSDEELLKMPLPPNKRNLRVLLLEVQSRIEDPAVPASALDRMLAGGLLNE